MAMHTEEEESIPQDMTLQIFSWLPVKSLMRFRCVSKFYNSIVLEPKFVDLHSSNYSKINHGDTKLIACVNDVCYAIEDHDEDENGTKYYQIENFNKLYDHIEGHLDYYVGFESDNGLFCIWDVKYIAICNPTTRDVRFLPNVTHEEFICSIGFEPEENKYKVVLTVDNYGGLSRAWVFTLGVDKSWREIIKYYQNGYVFCPYETGICISGIIYRFCYAPEFCIVAFDVKSEIFTSITMSIELGNSLHESRSGYKLIQVNGKLGILNFVDFWCTEDLHLWVLGEEEWEHEIFQFPLGWEHDDIYLTPTMICKYHGEEIVFAVHMRSTHVLVFFFYDVNNKSWRHFEVQEFPDRVNSIFTYTESLFPLENIGTTYLQP